MADDRLTEAEQLAMAMLKGSAISGRPIEVVRGSTIGAGAQVNMQVALRLAEKGLVTLDLQLTLAGCRRAAYSDIDCYVNPYDFDPPIPEEMAPGGQQ